MNKWKFKLIPKRPIKMSCPYSEKCEIAYAEDLEKHMAECPDQPINELLKYQRRLKYLCDRDHKLEYLEKLPRGVTDPICLSCNGTENVRSMCKLCGTMYCNGCRIPEYTQRGCPASHKYKM
jgi:hypothetical protein